MYEKLLHKTKLNHHHYTGKVVHHSHTMYSWLLVFLVVAACALGMATYTLTDVQADQGSISIGGIVKAPTPTDAPQITAPLSGTRVFSRVLPISGSCKSGLFVEIYSNNLFVGSTDCSKEGTFRMFISLFEGSNNIQAFLFDLNSDNGPGSDIITVTYTEPAELQEEGISDLIVKLPEHYKGALEDTEVALTPEVIGGEGPYDIHLDWKDGGSYHAIVPSEGVLSATHVYPDPGNYRVNILAADSHGRTFQINVMMLISGAAKTVATPNTGGGIQLPSIDGIKSALAQGWVTLSISGMMLGAFWIGQKITYAHMLRQIRITKFAPRK